MPQPQVEPQSVMRLRYGIEYTIYIGNVPDSIAPHEPEKLRALFDKFGEIKTCSVVRRRDNFQFGHVNFARPEDAAKAMVEMQGHKIHPSNIGLKIRLRDTRKDSETARQVHDWMHKFRAEPK